MNHHHIADTLAVRRRTRYDASLLIVLIAGMLAAACPAFAQTGIRRTRPSAGNPLALFTVGTGLEFESDAERKQYDAPLVLEYSPTQQLKFTFESAGSRIDSKIDGVSSVTGFDDLETSVEYEFLRERRYMPALTAIGLVKWPVATNAEIGSPGTDYAIGLIASKGLVHFDLDLNLLYTFSGDPERKDTLETSLAVTYPLTYKFELLAEVWHASDTGDTETTVGFGWNVTPFLSLEQGALHRSDGTWQWLFAVAYAFGGTD